MRQLSWTHDGEILEVALASFGLQTPIETVSWAHRIDSLVPITVKFFVTRDRSEWLFWTDFVENTADEEHHSAGSFSGPGGSDRKYFAVAPLDAVVLSHVRFVFPKGFEAWAMIKDIRFHSQKLFDLAATMTVPMTSTITNEMMIVNEEAHSQMIWDRKSEGQCKQTSAEVIGRRTVIEEAICDSQPQSQYPHCPTMDVKGVPPNMKDFKASPVGSSSTVEGSVYGNYINGVRSEMLPLIQESTSLAEQVNGAGSMPEFQVLVGHPTYKADLQKARLNSVFVALPYGPDMKIPEIGHKREFKRTTIERLLKAKIQERAELLKTMGEEAQHDEQKYKGACQ